MKTGIRGAYLLCATLLSLVASCDALAQRASENAVTAAEDAFGVSVGRESIGLYTSDNVRGFSAIDAGNARLDGLYFDPVWLPSARLQQSTAIRVGIAAQGFAFPAPTGVVDYSLRHPGDHSKASIFASADSYGFGVIEADAEAPIVAENLSVGGGVGANRERYPNGTTDVTFTQAVLARWRPASTIETLLFWSESEVSDSKAYPIYIPTGDYLPPSIPLGHFNGPIWAASRMMRFNYGGLAKWTPMSGWTIQAGVFRSGARYPINFTNLYVDVTTAGYADQQILVDPPARNASTSGEFRVSRTFEDGAGLHKVLITLRGRDRDRTYEGTDSIDLGLIRLNESQNHGPPAIAFQSQDRDRIKQGTVGIGYEGRWKDVGELSVSVQKTDYTKRAELAGYRTEQVLGATPLLYAAAAAVHATKLVALYASATTGLEDSGSAPGSASNRDEPLPASRTRQVDAGFQLTLTDKLKLVAGIFDLHKPYFEFDDAHRFRRLGDVDNRGFELSLAGSITPEVDAVVGAMAGRPRVSGEGVRLGVVGQEPVNLPEVRVGANLNWRPALLRDVTLEIGLTHVGRLAATTDDAVHVPAITLVDIGTRYALKIANHPAQLRLSVTNIGNIYGVELFGAGAYDAIAGRAAQLSLGVDF
jgi:iron complex outermembrane receptor protein